MTPLPHAPARPYEPQCAICIKPLRSNFVTCREKNALYERDESLVVLTQIPGDCTK